MLFRVLGPVDIAADGQRVELRSDRQRAIVAVLLAARGAAVSTDALMDALWGDEQPRSALRSLHSHIARLRRLLGELTPDGAQIVTEGNRYRLDLSGHEVDADLFEVALERASRDVEVEPDRAVRGLDDALALWRGQAFGELADLELVRPEAVRLDGLRSAATADRVEARLAAGGHRELVAELEATVASSPLAERPHGQLMMALYRSEQQVEALEVFRRLQDRLRDEVGVDPSPGLRDLHERMLRQDDDLAVGSPVSSPSNAVSLPSPRPELDGSPSPVEAAGGGDRLVGREEDTTTVLEMVVSSSLVTLTGPGGVGKSRLARAVADQASALFDGGAVVCELAAVRDPASVTTALVRALGVRHDADRSPDEVLLTVLEGRRMLLVLDNCEHLLAGVAPIVAALHDRCPSVSVLATSREYLRVPGERVREVTPLTVPRSYADATEVAATSAGALFCARAQEVEPSFELTDANARTVAELCRRLDGIPLAIELAAARIHALGPDDLAERLDNRFELLTGGSHRGAGRHRTLQAVVDWSHDLLAEDEAHLFAELSVFAGRFTLPAVERVCATPATPEPRIAGLLAELVAKSLVAVDRTERGLRYHLLDTLRVYGAQRLEESGSPERARHAHATYHLERAAELGRAVRERDERHAIGEVDALMDDLRVAHAWLHGRGEAEEALRLPAALHDELVFRPRPEVIAWSERALELPGAEEQPSYAAAMVLAGRGAMDRGELDRARALAERALERAGDQGLEGLYAYYLLTTTALYEGRLDDVLRYSDRRIELAERLDDDYHLTLAHVSRVLGYLYRGDARTAAHAAVDARAAAERSGNLTARAWALYSSAEALLDTDPEGAASSLERAIDAAEQVDAGFIRGVALVSLAALRGRRGRTEAALVSFRDAVEHWRLLGNTTNQLTALRNLVELLARIGADEPAAVLYGAVVSGGAPSFGDEAERLASAWTQVEERLGPEAARCAATGGELSLAQIVDRVLGELDRLMEPTGAVTAELRAP